MKSTQYFLVTLAFLSMIACSGSKGTPKDTIVLAWESPPRSLDPRYATDANSQYLANLTHCSLVTFNPDGATVPYLAKSWKWKTPTRLELEIHSNVKFSDGSGVTAKDVVETYNAVRDPNAKHKSPRAGALRFVKNIEVTGPHSLAIELEKPDAPFVTNLSFGIVRASQAKSSEIQDPKDSVGCGPYKVSHSGLNSVKLEINPHYSLDGITPKTQKIEIKIVQDESTRFAKLRKGELDLVQKGLGPEKLEKIKKEFQNLQIAKRAGLNTTYLGFNMKDPLTGRVEVRQAIARAVNREAIIKHVLKGYAVPATTLIPQSDPYYLKSLKGISFNPDEAKKILDQAGLKDPDGDGPKARFQISYKTTTNTTRVTIAKAIASQLKKVGITVKVQSLEWGRFKDDVEKGKVQLWSLSWIGFKDPDIFRYTFATESFPPNGGNRGWYSNSKLDEVLNRAREETSTPGRKKLYAKVQEIVSQELPYVFLWHEEIYAVHRKELKNFKVYADGRLLSLREAHKI